MAKDGKRVTEEAPDTGASRVKKLDKATALLLEQVGELVIDGRLYVKEPASDKTGEQDA